jgi:hypothetical protein
MFTCTYIHAQMYVGGKSRSAGTRYYRLGWVAESELQYTYYNKP